MKKLLLQICILSVLTCSLPLISQVSPVIIGTASSGGLGYGAVFYSNTGSTSINNTTSLGGGAQGTNPKGSVILAPNGKFYGLSYGGGSNSLGTIFELGFSGPINVKVSFNSTNGSNPAGELLLANDGNLYGLTTAGGANSLGVLFKYVPGASSITVLRSFNTADGTAPSGSLIQAGNNLIYGLTQGGGTYGDGTLFSFDIGTSAYTVLHNFNASADGATPKGSLFEASNGKLYGMAYTGGANNFGTLFEYNIGTTIFTKLKDFTGTGNGSSPYGGLIEPNAGILVGVTCSGGTSNYGVLFDYNIGSTILTVRHHFVNNASDGGSPLGTLRKAPSNGLIYGVTSIGGLNSTGTIFEYNPSTFAYNLKVSLNTTNGGNNPQSVTLIEYLPLDATTSQNNVSCNGGNNGSATVTPSGGTAPYSYAWSPAGGTSATAAGLSAGSYTCTITEAGGFQIQKTFSITQPPSPLSVTISAQTNVSCNGGNNGTATASPSGGVPGYSYNWTPLGGTGINGTGLMAGTSTITVTDANGCVATTTVIITQPSALNSSVPSQTNVSCNGGTNGSATVLATGGTAGYSYSWAPIGGTAATASGLVAGNYTCTITDANSCVRTQTVAITQPTLLNSSVSSQTNVSCNGGNNGSATVTPAGGTPGYTFSWAPVGGTLATASGLAAGNYTCTITDANGCVKTQTVSITQPSVVNPTLSAQTNVSCNGGNNGTATVSASGGTPTYTYNWTPAGGTTTTATGLSAGSYTCSVTDANGCLSSVVAIITQPTILSAGILGSSNVTCNGGSDGSASVNQSGGTSGYTYSWAPSGGTASTASGLVAGTYTCTVTDANSCTATTTVAITQPSALNASISGNNVMCFGNATGDATVSVGGGTPSYFYTWSPSGGSAATATGLSAGSYTCNISDINGCVLIKNITITEPSQLTASILSQNDVLCNGGNTGNASVSASGGIGGFSYSWSPFGGASANASGLFAGTYTCTVTDANLCNANQVVVISEPTAIVSSASGSDVTCFGYSDGTATNNPTGGTPPYTFSWTPTGQTTQTASGLSSGNHTVTITDNNGCFVTDFSTVSEPSAIVANASETANAGCAGMSNGVADVSVSGGMPPYFFSWTSGGSGSTEMGLVAGTYTCSIVDNNSCPATATVTITENAFTDLYGSVTFPSGTINGGFVYAFKQQASTSGIDTVDVVSINPGASANYLFMGLPADNYYVKVILDTAFHPTSVPTYYGNTFQWDSSLVVTHGCLQTDTANIDVLELNAGTGTGFISGYVIEGNGYTGLRLYNETHPDIPFVPGGPLKGIDIKLGKNPGGGIQARVMSDSTGYYEFTDIPDGNYTIYVDIPNLPMDSTRTVVVDAGSGSTQFDQNNYYADSSNIFILDSTVAIGIYSSAVKYDNGYSIYPNPAKDKIILSFNKDNSKNVVIELNNSLGQQVLAETIQNNTKGLFEYELNISDIHLNAGVYFISILSEGKKYSQRIVILE